MALFAFLPGKEEQIRLATASAFRFLPPSPAWKTDVMSEAEQPSCDCEDGRAGTGS